MSLLNQTGKYCFYLLTYRAILLQLGMQVYESLYYVLLFMF